MTQVASIMMSMMCFVGSLQAAPARRIAHALMGQHASVEQLATIQSQLMRETIFDVHNDSKNQSIKFLSYNIQLSGLDNPKHLWKDRKNAVCELLSYAEVVALQEISHEQLLDVRKALPKYMFVGFNTVTGNDLIIPVHNKQEGLVIGFRIDVFSLKSNKIQWYSDTPDVPSQKWGNWVSALPKALQTVTLAFRINGQEMNIFNSHFAHDEDPEEIVNPRFESSKMELDLLKNYAGKYWISAGDRNFHTERDVLAYGLYRVSRHVAGSRRHATIFWGETTTFIGYEGHPRMSEITAEGALVTSYLLDASFHNSSLIKSNWWISHFGEYDDALCLLPIGNCKQPVKRLFASDHTAIFTEYILQDFYS